MITFRESSYGKDIMMNDQMIGQIYKDRINLTRIQIFNYSLIISDIEEIIDEAMKLK